MTTFSDIDLPQLPAPTVVELLDFEQIFESMRDQLSGLQPLLFTAQGEPALFNAVRHTSDNGEVYFKVPATTDELIYLQLDSDPSVKLLQIVAYRELLLRQRVNEAARSTMLAFATGPDLDHEAARFGVERLVINPGDESAIPPVTPVYESDNALRRRAQLALEGYSTAGPIGAYAYHALSASAQIKSVDIAAPAFARLSLTSEQSAVLPADATAIKVVDDVGLPDPKPGDVAITVLALEGDGTASQTILDAVSDTLNDDAVRPLTDRPRVRSAEIVPYTLHAVLTLHSGPDPGIVRQAAVDAITAYVADAHRIAQPPTFPGFYRALKQPGVYDVELIQPTDAIALEAWQAAYCTSITVTVGGIYG